MLRRPKRGQLVPLPAPPHAPFPNSNRCDAVSRSIARGIVEFANLLFVNLLCIFCAFHPLPLSLSLFFFLTFLEVFDSMFYGVVTQRLDSPGSPNETTAVTCFAA